MIRPLVLILLCAACRPSDKEAPDTDTPTDSTPDDSAVADDTADSGDSGDSGVSDDTGDSGDTAPPGPPDFLATVVNEDWAADMGYDEVTYTLNPEALDPYPSLFADQQPTFKLLVPKERPEGPIPLLLWIHGGAFADDSATDDEGGEPPRGCGLDNVEGRVDKAIVGQFPAWLAMQRGWAMVVPRNDWCDFWVGLGEDDPVDPQHHYGYVHVARVLDFLASGQAGFDLDSDAIYGWGTSSGGAAILHIAARAGNFAGVIDDSGPSNMLFYYTVAPEAPSHVFGGAPTDEDGADTEAMPRYRAAGGDTLVDDGLLTTPIYAVWNTYDVLNGANHPRTLVEALERVYDPAGLRWGSLDLHHLSPGDQYHTQSWLPQVPWGYTGEAMFQFLEGKQIAWIEAEDGCVDPTDCPIGSVAASSAPEDELASFSQGEVRQTRAAEGSGVAWTAPVPDRVPAGVPVTATMVVEMQGMGGLPAGQIVGTFTYTEGSKRVERVLTAGDFAPETGSTDVLFSAQYQGTTVSFTQAAVGGGALSWRVMGLGRANLDAVFFAWEE